MIARGAALTRQFGLAAHRKHPRAVLEAVVELSANDLQKHFDRTITPRDLALELANTDREDLSPAQHIYFKPEAAIDGVDTYAHPTHIDLVKPQKHSPITVHTSLLATKIIPKEEIAIIKAAAEANAGIFSQAFGAFQKLAEEPTTGLANRQGLSYFVEHHAFLNGSGRRNEAATLGLIYLDLDRFKEINDTRGHHVGDEQLRHVAAVLRKVIYASKEAQRDSLVARVGGDEYLIAIRYAEQHDLKEAIKTITELFPQPVALERRDQRSNASYITQVDPRLGFSAGYTVFSTEGWHPAEVNARFQLEEKTAEQHMYRLKSLKKAGKE